MKLYLAPNMFTEEQMKRAVKCARILEDECGHPCALSRENSIRLYGDDRAAHFSPEACDLMVSLGGDGAVLRAAKTAIQYHKPLLGINGGRLGFLCAMDYREVHRFNALWPELMYSERRLLALWHQGEKRLAMNDVVIGKRHFGETVDLDVAVQEMPSFHMRGDGLIIATPTGSTAYNLSAGGPILDAGLPAILLTPICAHGSVAHPRAIRDDKTISVSVRNEEAVLYVDGVSVGFLDGELRVQRAEEALSLYVQPSHIDPSLNESSDL